MIDGKYQPGDIPGTLGMPSQDEIRALAIKMGREMYPEVFNDYEEPKPVPLSPEEFDRKCVEAGLMKAEESAYSSQPDYPGLAGFGAYGRGLLQRLIDAGHVLCEKGGVQAGEPPVPEANRLVLQTELLELADALAAINAH